MGSACDETWAGSCRGGPDVEDEAPDAQEVYRLHIVTNAIIPVVLSEMTDHQPLSTKATYCVRAPSKHETFTQCCFHVWPASKTVAQHWNDIGWTSRVWWEQLTHSPTWLKQKVSATYFARSKRWAVISTTWPRVIRSMKSVLESATFYLPHRMLRPFVATLLKSYGHFSAFEGIPAMLKKVYSQG